MQMIRFSMLMRVAALLLALLVSGCATSSSGSSAGHWHSGQEGRAQPYQTILVVGVSEGSVGREAFEDTLANEISKSGSKGVQGYRVQSQLGEKQLSRDVVVAMAEKSGADAVLVIRAVSHDAKAGKSQEDVAVHLTESSR